MAEKIHRNALKPGYKIHWYEIKSVLGQGGFGITYLAYDTNLDKNVAIKEYLPIELAVREGDSSVHPLTEDRGKQYQWGLDRFVSEARTLSRFEHPNIVRVHAVFEENNTGYMVMACEEGQSMQQLLAGKKTMEEAALIKILIPILGGLELVHQAGFIHRDIKPDNIFIRKDGSPVLLDFGSARQALGQEQKTLTSLVSPGYAPFEQYYSKSDAQGPWTDIYGLGATLYRAIAGVAPVDAVDRSKSILEGDTDYFVSATEIGKGKYSERFLKAIDHALAFKNQDRPQTIAEWKEEFGITRDMNEINFMEQMEQTPTQPGTKIVKETSTRNSSFAITLLIIIISFIVVIYFQKDLINLIKPSPGTVAPEPLQDSSESVVATIPQPEQEAQPTADETDQVARDENISQLLVKADEAFQQGYYLEPVNDNALDYYLQALELDPENATAQAGKQNIIEHFINSAYSLIDEERFDAAERMLVKAEIVEPDARTVKLARLNLEEKKAKADRLAREEQQKRMQEEQKQKEEAQAKRLADLEKQKQEAEAKRLALVEKQKQEEERLRLEAKKQQEEEQHRKEEEEKQLAMERERQKQMELQQCKLKKQEPVSEPQRYNVQSYYSALAIGKNNGWGESWGYPTRSDAENRAMLECKKNDSGCELKLWSTSCIAYAKSSDGATGWAWSDTANNAGKNAIANCEQYSKCCNIQSTFCADQQ